MTPLQRPARSTIALHWLVAAGVSAMLAFGFFVSSLPRGPEKTEWVQTHKSCGMIVLCVVLARAAWRLLVRVPRDGTPSWEAIAARAAHALLLAATIVAPLSGVLKSVSYARPVQVFGLPVIPQLLAEKNEALNEAASALHVAAAWTLVALITIHIAAALKHHLVDRDDTLLRMLPWRDRTPEAAQR